LDASSYSGEGGLTRVFEAIMGSREFYKPSRINRESICSRSPLRRGLHCRRLAGINPCGMAQAEWRFSSRLNASFVTEF
jgi:hypothetical protein